MQKDVKVIEGGKIVSTKKMNLKPVKEFSNDITLFENDESQAVVYFKAKDEYILISIDMA